MELVSDSEAESTCESVPDDTDDDPTVDLSGAESDGSDSSTVYPEPNSFDKSVKQFPHDCHSVVAPLGTERTDSTKISQSKGLFTSFSDNGRDTNFDVATYMKMEWADNVSRLARTILVTRQFNESKQIPIPADVAKLQEHVKEEIAKLDLDDISIDTYDAAIRLSQTRLLVLNKRRSGEIDGMLLKNYINRCKVTDSEEALRSYISPNERRMLDDHIVIEVRGKNHRGVPIIVPKDTQPLLAYIADAKVRNDIGITSSNPYMFANTKVGYRRSYDSMKDYCMSAGLKAQDRITSVSLRKFSATLAQIYDLSANDQMNLANHLGHSMDVHKISYRQTSRVIECIDIAKMMLLEEHGITGKYAGKKLSEIQLEEIYGNLLPEITTDQDKEGHSGVRFV